MVAMRNYKVFIGQALIFGNVGRIYIRINVLRDVISHALGFIKRYELNRIMNWMGK